MRRSTANSLIRFIPPTWQRVLARRYVAGDTISAAADTAAELLSERNLRSTLRLLTVDVDGPAVAEQNVETSLALIDHLSTAARTAEEGVGPTVSIRPSAFTTAPLDRGGDAAGVADAVRQLCERASDKGVRLTLEMEDRHWTSFTLDLFARLRSEGHDQLGTALQSRMLRTERDIDQLPDGSRIRLVTGMYEEPEEVAFTRLPLIRNRQRTHARRLLDLGHYLEFATCDEQAVRRFFKHVVEMTGVGPDRYELQFLYGVPRDRLLRETVDAGHPVRLCLPFATDRSAASPYLRQCLAEHSLTRLPLLRKLAKKRR